VPGRYIAPVVLAGLSLQVAVLGMYWDVGYHIDHGRDQGVFTAPHMFIVAGLQASSSPRCCTAPWTGRPDATSAGCRPSACA